MENKTRYLNQKVKELVNLKAIPATEKSQSQTEFGLALEKQTSERRVFLKVVNLLLGSERLTANITELNNRQLIKQLQMRFQENIKNHYRETGLANRIDTLSVREKINPTNIPLDEQAVNLIAEESQGTHGWVDMLPNLREEVQQAGLNCTMGSAFLHLALESLGFNQVRTVLRAGHHVVIRRMNGGSIKLYDTASVLSTKDGRLVGYSREFLSNKIKNKQEVPGKGFGFELISDTEDKIGGFIKSGNDGKYRQSFFAYEPEIKMDLAIALENLSEIKDDAAKIGTKQTISSIGSSERYEQARKLCKKYPELEMLDYKAIKSELTLFDGYDYL